MSKFFAFLSRMKYIHRWGLMHNSRQENLSEHTFETAYLACALANIENALFDGKYDAERIAACALLHDSAEIITGDLPTPVKYKTEEMRLVYKKAELAAEQTLLSSLPAPLREVYRGYLEPSPEERAIIKAADKLSALIKCMEEARMGNRDFAGAEQTVRAWLDGCELQSVRYFMERMLPAYALTLDELSQ